MANLTTNEKQILEKLFQMDGGSVLNFTNRTMREFFNDEVGIDIYSEKYNYYGGGKAKRMRRFWEVTDNVVVSKSIFKLIEYIEAQLIIRNLEKSYFYEDLLRAGRKIASKLSGAEYIQSDKLENILEEDLVRIWGDRGIRFFLSHRVEFKKEAEALKLILKQYGISCFVSHTSIKPTQEWRKEIERALWSMDVFGALLTDNFRDSEWTDQEVGFALCRRVPVIPISINGNDPHGFMGKNQKLPASFDDIQQMAKDIFSIVMENPIIGDKLRDLTMHAFIKSDSFDSSIYFVKNVLPYFISLNRQQIELLKKGFQENNQINKCSAVRKYLPKVLKDITQLEFFIDENELAEVTKFIGPDNL